MKFKRYMSVIIITSPLIKDTTSSSFEFEWKLQDPPQTISNNSILEVEVTGEELLWIKKHMTNIQMVDNKRTITWFGDTAKFIAVNIGAVLLGD